MRRLAPLVRLLVGLVLVTPLLAGGDPAVAQDHPTTSATMSFTVTGGYRGQETAAHILARHDMQGTFYISSRLIGLPDYLDKADVRSIAASGSEIGGGAVSHRDLSTMTDQQVLKEICADRWALSSWGSPVTIFAYPGACTASESLPPLNAYELRTTSPGATVADQFEQLVRWVSARPAVGVHTVNQ